MIRQFFKKYTDKGIRWAMTSSFTRPGGVTVATLYRAEPMIILGSHGAQMTRTI
ncbi:MAG: hypothetical protein ACI8P0_002811, partial [Planctomycetaceae bacterium]